MSVDILAPIRVAPIAVTTSVKRPGKRTALLEATGTVGDRPVLCVRAWRFPRIGGDYPATPEIASDLRGETDRAEDGGVIPVAHVDGYLSATQFRFTTGSFAEFGPAEAWGRSLCTRLPGEELTPWQRVPDSRGLVERREYGRGPRRYPAINSDLHVVVHRDPVGDWIGIRSETHSARGHGAAAYARLADVSGIVGACAQSLYASTAGR